MKLKKIVIQSFIHLHMYLFWTYNSPFPRTKWSNPRTIVIIKNSSKRSTRSQVIHRTCVARWTRDQTIRLKNQCENFLNSYFGFSHRRWAWNVLAKIYFKFEFLYKIPLPIYLSASNFCLGIFLLLTPGIVTDREKNTQFKIVEFLKKCWAGSPITDHHTRLTSSVFSSEIWGSVIRTSHFSHWLSLCLVCSLV